MTDILGHRLKVGSLLPSTNSSVEPEIASMSVDGVTHLAARIDVPNQEFRSDADAEAIVAGTQPDLLPALGRLMAANPDRVIMAMAVPCFWDGQAGCGRMKQRLEDHAGVPVTVPPEAIGEALTTIGAKTIAIVSPYMPLADAHVTSWFEQAGYSVHKIMGLRAPREDQVIDITPGQLQNAFDTVDDTSVDALVHVGTSIAMARLAAPFEARYGKPVISVNVACWWATLRAAGIDDRLAGFGRLFSDF